MIPVNNIIELPTNALLIKFKKKIISSVDNNHNRMKIDVGSYYSSTSYKPTAAPSRYIIKYEGHVQPSLDTIIRVHIRVHENIVIWVLSLWFMYNNNCVRTYVIKLFLSAPSGDGQSTPKNTISDQHYPFFLLFESLTFFEKFSPRPTMPTRCIVIWLSLIRIALPLPLWAAWL